MIWQKIHSQLRPTFVIPPRFVQQGVALVCFFLAIVTGQVSSHLDLDEGDPQDLFLRAFILIVEAGDTEKNLPEKGAETYVSYWKALHTLKKLEAQHPSFKPDQVTQYVDNVRGKLDELKEYSKKKSSDALFDVDGVAMKRLQDKLALEKIARTYLERENNRLKTEVSENEKALTVLNKRLESESNSADLMIAEARQERKEVRDGLKELAVKESEIIKKQESLALALEDLALEQANLESLKRRLGEEAEAQKANSIQIESEKSMLLEKENKELQAVIKSLEEKIAGGENSLLIEKNEIVELESAYLRQEKQLGESLAKIERIEAELLSVQNTLKVKSGEADQLLEDHRLLTEHAVSLAAERKVVEQAMEKRIADLKKANEVEANGSLLELKEKEAVLIVLREENEKLKAEFSGRERQKTETEDQLFLAKQANDRLNREFKQKSEEIHLLSVELEKSQQRVSEKEEELSETKKKIATLASEKTQLEAGYHVLENKLQKSTLRIVSLEERVDESKRDVAQLENENQSLKKAMKGLSLGEKSIQLTVEELIANRSLLEHSLSQSIAKYESEAKIRSSLETNIKELKLVKNSLELEALKAAEGHSDEKERLEKQLKETAAKATALEKDLDEMRFLLSGRDEEIGKLEQQMVVMNEELTKLNEFAKEKLESPNEVNAEFEEGFWDELLSLEAEIDELGASKLKAEALLETKEKILTELREDNQIWQLSNQDLIVKNKDLLAEVLALEQQNEQDREEFVSLLDLNIQQSDFYEQVKLFRQIVKRHDRLSNQRLEGKDELLDAIGALDPELVSAFRSPLEKVFDGQQLVGVAERQLLSGVQKSQNIFYEKQNSTQNRVVKGAKIQQEIQQRYALAKAMVDEGDMTVASGIYEFIIEQYPGQVDIMVDYASLEASQEEYESAALRLQEANILRSDVPKHHYLEGLYWYRAGDLESSEESIEKSIALDANQARCYGVLGNIYGARKNYGLAKIAYEKSIDIDATEPSMYFNLALVSLELGDESEAQTWYKKSLSLGGLPDEELDKLVTP